MNSILDLLIGGDRRSIGRANEVSQLILQQPDKFSDLFQGLYAQNPVIRMRAADVIEKVTANDPHHLIPYKQAVLDLLDQTSQIEVQWHLAQIVPRLPLNQDEVQKSYASIEKYLESSSSIVKAFSLQCLFDLSQKAPQYLPITKQYLEKGSRSSTKAVQTRCRRLLEEIEKYE